MGTYVSIRIGNFDFLSYKNSFGALLFPFSQGNLTIEESVDEDGEIYTKRYFTLRIDYLKKILDSFGYSIKQSKIEFEKLKKEKLEFIQYCLEDGDGNTYGLSYEDVSKNFTYGNWRKAVLKYAKILAKDKYCSTCNDYKKLNRERSKVKNIAEKFVIESLPFGEGYWGFEDVDFESWTIFRVILDAFPNNDEIILDYTDLYESGWCNDIPDDDDYNVPKTIILTEGKYDAEVLCKSIGLLYPYMSKFYSFINFSEYKVQGSTNFLTHYLKAFIASGIQNRIIALYDNDSAGLAEIIELKKINIPSNFKIIPLPDIELANNYPTIGPNGEEYMNINGRACSIELFLGKDVLSEDGKYIPVHWKGYIDKTGTYQGEVLKKNKIQEAFARKYSYAIESDNYTIDSEQWTEMRQLLECIFSAFS